MKKEKLETITLSEFNKKYRKECEDWDFSLFKIVCNKCGSDMVEFGGNAETENGYYGEVTFKNKIIIKCHKCGNAHVISYSECGYNNYCDCGGH